MLMRETAKEVSRPACYLTASDHAIGRLELELRWNCENVAWRMHHQGHFTLRFMTSTLT
jgi:hypothetical protein